MFDTNAFKKSVKEWMGDNPSADVQDLIDFCEEQIPASQFAANNWVIEQTVSWYRHILAQRDMHHTFEDEEAS